MTLIEIFHIDIKDINLGNIFSFGKKKIDKTTARILFVDDIDFPVVDNLHTAGWSVERVKDIKNTEDEEVERAHIIFVDCKGVGKHLAESDEGIGLIRAIKNAYGDKKRVILYSQYNLPLGPQLKVADNQLSKDSNTYEFITMIESELKKLK